MPTPVGTMRGTYQMVAEDGHAFDADIPLFTLSVPRVAALAARRLVALVVDRIVVAPRLARRPIVHHDDADARSPARPALRGRTIPCDLVRSADAFAARRALAALRDRCRPSPRCAAGAADVARTPRAAAIYAAGAVRRPARLERRSRRCRVARARRWSALPATALRDDIWPAFRAGCAALVASPRRAPCGSAVRRGGRAAAVDAKPAVARILRASF